MKRIKNGCVYLDKKYFNVEYYPNYHRKKPEIYYFEISRCNTIDKLKMWIRQLREKTWSEEDMIRDLKHSYSDHFGIPYNEVDKL